MEGRVEVRLRPGGGRDELLGFRDGVLQARVSAPPVDGRANEALRKLIAKQLRVAPSRVTIVRGERSRDKLIAVQGMTSEALAAAFEAATGELGARARRVATRIAAREPVDLDEPTEATVRRLRDESER